MPREKQLLWFSPCHLELKVAIKNMDLTEKFAGLVHFHIGLSCSSFKAHQQVLQVTCHLLAITTAYVTFCSLLISNRLGNLSFNGVKPHQASHHKSVFLPFLPHKYSSLICRSDQQTKSMALCLIPNIPPSPRNLPLMNFFQSSSSASNCHHHLHIKLLLNLVRSLTPFLLGLHIGFPLYQMISPFSSTPDHMKISRFINYFQITLMREKH